MKVYCSLVPNNTQDTEDTFEISNTGNKYYYSLEITEDNQDLYLQDTCNRMIPLDLESIPELINAMRLLHRVHTMQKYTNALVQETVPFSTTELEVELGNE